MQVGDILAGYQLDGLPVGSVVVYDEDDGSGFNTVVRIPSGFSWIDGSEDRSHHFKHELGGICVGGWTLIHLPAVPALKVGDVIATGAQGAALPIGTVAVDDDGDASSAPVIKVGANMWMYYDGASTAEFGGDFTPVDHKIVYIPSADTGAIRTAA